MKTFLILLVIMACSPWSAFAEPCAGIEAELTSVAKQLSHGDTLGAEKTLVPLEAAHPDCELLVLDRARIQAAKSEDGADKTFVRYTVLKPRDAQGWAYLARYLIAQGEYQRADSSASLAMDCDPNDPTAMAVQGQILDMKRHSQDGVALLEKAIHLDPDDAEARFDLGSIEDRLKHPKQAVEYFTGAVAINPSDARAWDYLALDLEPLGEIDRAQQAYLRALAVNRAGAYFDAFLPYNYGRFLMKLNQLSASKEQLDRAVVLTPQARAAWYERARLDVRMSDLQKARSDAEKAAGLADPQGIIADLQIYILLEQIYSRLGETELARKYAELGRVTPSPVRTVSIAPDQ
ncbi:MAG TPA: tetratricopeptide repeat protein [Terracidiphilus sp.]